MTDTIATGIKKKFVAGLFDTPPPPPNFRVNMLMAKEEPTKIRPILNLSAPQGASFNDAVNVHALRKLTMCSPYIFAQTLRKAGKNALFAKLDCADAYKLIPCSPQNRRYYGFKWLGKFYFETQIVFGNRAAPAQFDDLAEIAVLLARTLAKIPKWWIHRQLDDTIIVSPQRTNYTPTFIETFQAVCKQLHVPLAPPDPNFEKAFGATTGGTVLVIIFDSNTLTWQLPEKKQTVTLNMLTAFMEAQHCTLHQFQNFMEN
jgi:hypothetical protein